MSIYGHYFLERSLPKGDVTLYHGSVNGDYKKILNNSPNNGKRWEKMRQSSFWFIKKEYAVMFATAELLKKHNSNIEILIDNDMKTLVSEDYEEEAENILKKEKSYVYVKTVDGKYVNGGQGRNFPEYSLDFSVKPDKVITNSYSDMRKCVKYVSNEYIKQIIEKYKTDSMTYGNSKFGILIDKIVYNKREDIKKSYKAIKKYNESGSTL